MTEEKDKKESNKKVEKKKVEPSKPAPKFYFDVKIETMLPATISYRVYAETPEDAVMQTKYMNPNSVKYKLFGRKDLKLIVYEAGCTFIKYIKNFR